MTKSPFEIRSDLVKLAQEHLEAQYDANLEFATNFFYQMVKEGTATAESYKQYVPAFPTTEDILEKAKEFYNFVSHTGPQK